ncbi:MAG: hypothetical protein ACERKV_10350 [Clostridiaceae bacterium]
MRLPIIWDKVKYQLGKFDGGSKMNVIKNVFSQGFGADAASLGEVMRQYYLKCNFLYRKNLQNFL